MDMITRPHETVGFPIIFSGYELDECRDQKGRFRLGRLRRYQEEKGLQVILERYHDTVIGWSHEVYKHAEPLGFSLVKARRMCPVCYLMAIKYRYRQKIWEHVFRYERNTQGGISVSGRLYTHSRWQILVK